MSKTIQFDDFVIEEESSNQQKKASMNLDDPNSYEIQFANPNTMKGLEKLNEFYIKPLLVRGNPPRSTNERNSIRTTDRKPLLSSNGENASFIEHVNDEENDDDAEDDLLVVNQLRQENFHLKTMNSTSTNRNRMNFS